MMEKVYEIYIKTTPERLEGLELGAWAVAGLSFPSPLLEIGSRLDSEGRGCRQGGGGASGESVVYRTPVRVDGSSGRGA